MSRTVVLKERAVSEDEDVVQQPVVGDEELSEVEAINLSYAHYKGSGGGTE